MKKIVSLVALSFLVAPLALTTGCCSKHGDGKHSHGKNSKGEHHHHGDHVTGKMKQEHGGK